MLVADSYQLSCLTKLVMASQQALYKLLQNRIYFLFLFIQVAGETKSYLCQVGVFGLLL